MKLGDENLFSALQNDTSICLILKILGYSLAKVNGNAKLIACIVEDYLMKLASMAIQNWSLRIRRWSLLVVDNLTSVPFVNSEAVVLYVDAQRTQSGYDFAVGPSVKDPTGVSAKGYDVTKNFELREGLIDLDIVALPMTFDGGCQSAESSTNNDDFDT
jgi:hypothetical protein